MVVWGVVVGDTCFVASASTCRRVYSTGCNNEEGGRGPARFSRPWQQMIEPCMKGLRTGVTGYGPDGRVSTSRCRSGRLPPLRPRGRVFLLFWPRLRRRWALSGIPVLLVVRCVGVWRPPRVVVSVVVSSASFWWSELVATNASVSDGGCGPSLA